MNIEERLNRAEEGLQQSLLEEVSKPKLERIPIALIMKDPGLQVRVALNMEKVSEYSVILRHRPDQLPPIQAFFEAALNRYWVWDGWHRVNAHEACAFTFVSALVRPGTRKDALLCAVGANAEHGVDRNSADKRRAITLLLKETDWVERGDREIQRQCKLLDHKLVGAVRKELEDAGEIPKITTRNAAVGRAIYTRISGNTPKQTTGGFPQSTLPGLQIQSTQERDANSQAVFERPASTRPNFCKRCNEELKPGREVWLHLRISGGFVAPETEVPEGDSQGLFPFGEDCAKLALKESTPEASSPVPPKLRCQWPSGCDKARVSVFKYCQEHSEQAVKDGEPEPPRIQDPAPSGNLEAQRQEAQEKVSVRVERPQGAEDSAPSKEPSWQHYNTPPLLIEPSRKVGKIRLDPCHNETSLWEAEIVITAEEDGLSLLYPWAQMAGEDLIVVNPPYNNLGPWVSRCALEATLGGQLILIVPNRSWSPWWQEAAKSCTLRCEVGQRVHFYRDGVSDRNPIEPTVLFYWGKHPGRFAAAFAGLGVISRMVPEEVYAQAAESLRAEALNERQQGLPFPATPQEGTPEVAPRGTVEYSRGERLAKLEEALLKATTIEACNELRAQLWENADVVERKEIAELVFTRKMQLGASEPSPWLARAKKQLEECLFREDFDVLFPELHSQASDDEERSELALIGTYIRVGLNHRGNVKPEQVLAAREPKKQGKMGACYWCKKKVLADWIHMDGGGADTCYACLEKRGEPMHGIYALTCDGSTIVRFAQTITGEKSTIWVTAHEAHALKNDKRLIITGDRHIPGHVETAQPERKVCDWKKGSEHCFETATKGERCEKHAPKEELMLHGAILDWARSMKEDGYHFEVERPGRDVMNGLNHTLVNIKDKVCTKEEKRDETRDQWALILTDTKGKVICVVHALKNAVEPISFTLPAKDDNKPIESPLKQKKTPPKPSRKESAAKPTKKKASAKKPAKKARKP